MNLLDTTKLQVPVYGEGEDYEALLCDQGELSTSIEIEGYHTIIADKTATQNNQYLVDQLSNFFALEDHRLIVSFINDPNDHRYFDHVLHYYDHCANRLGLEVHDIHHADAKALQKITRSDRLLLTIETGAGVLDIFSGKQADRMRYKTAAKLLQAIGFQGDSKAALHQKHYGQNPLSFNQGVMRHHQDTLKSIIATLNAIDGLAFHVHTALETLQCYRRIFNPNASDDWAPVTADANKNYNPMHVSIDDSNTIAAHMLPSLVTQVIGDDMALDNDGSVYLNGFYYLPMYLDIPQAILTGFKALLHKTLSLPYIVNWHLSAGSKGIDSLLSRASFLGLAGIIPGPNTCRRIKEEGEVMEAIRKQESEPLALYRLSVLTWHQDKDSLKIQGMQLKKMLEDWGTQTLNIEKALPHQSMMEVIPSLTDPKIHKAIPCCVMDAFTQMPWQRFRSPWSEGIINFINAEDFSIYPVDIGEKQKNFPRAISLGRPGMGKTFMNASILLATLFREPYRQLPLTGVITIGYDGKLFADSLRDALPQNKKHLVFYDEPQLNENYAVNIFDTPYGARVPSNSQRANIVNFIDQCVADLGQLSFGRDFSALLDEIVLASYQYFGDQSDHPKAWTQGLDDTIDTQLQREGFTFSKLRNYSWWELFDHFHQQGNHRMAYRCQQQAMPTIKELPDVLPEFKSIVDSARNIKTVQGVRLLDILINKIKLICTKYPNAVITTRYNIEGTRIHVLDLQYVCGKQDEDTDSDESEEERQASVMYMLYVNMVLNKFNIHKDFASFKADITLASTYHDYHRNLIQQESGLPKIIRVYEKHRSKKAKYFNTQLSRVVREGRKYGYDFGGDSQRLDDWDQGIVLQMGCIFYSR